MELNKEMFENWQRCTIAAIYELLPQYKKVAIHMNKDGNYWLDDNKKYLIVCGDCDFFYKCGQLDKFYSNK